MDRYFVKVSFNFALEFTGKTYICRGISSWKDGNSMKSIHFSARSRFFVPRNIPTNSICLKHDPSLVITPVLGIVSGDFDSMTSNGGLEPYETTIGRSPPQR